MKFGLACCLGKNWDFISVTALNPINKLAVGLDKALWDASADKAADFFSGFYWNPPYLSDDWTRTTFYPCITIVRTWNYGVTETIVQKAYPFYTNNWNLQGVADGDDTAPVNRNLTTDPDQSEDLRLTGLPNTFETTTVTTWQLLDGTVVSGPTGGTSANADGIWYRDPTGTELTKRHQDSAVLPDVSVTSIFQRYPNDDGSAGTPDGSDGTDAHARQRGIASERITVSLLDGPGGIAYSDFFANTQAMLDGVALTPGSAVSTVRETPGQNQSIYLDYLGTSAVYQQLNFMPVDAVYDSSGEYVLTIPSKHVRHLLGIICGANEPAGATDVFATYSAVTTNIMDGSGTGGVECWPYRWDAGLEATAIRTAGFDGGINRVGATVDPTLYPNTFSFISKLSTITLKNGVPNAPVTAKVSPTHVREILIFPIRGDSGGIRIIRTGMVDSSQKLWPAVNSKQPNDSGHFDVGGGAYSLTGFRMSKSLIRVPINAMDAVQDVTQFQFIQQPAGFPDNYLLENRLTGANLETLTIYHKATLAPGEYIYDPSSITGQGFLSFGTSDEVTP